MITGVDEEFIRDANKCSDGISRSRDNTRWCMNQSVYETKSVDGTESVSGSDNYESDFEEYDKDSLPEFITKLFTDEETPRNINANDEETPSNINANNMSNDQPTIIANHKYQ